MKSETEIVAEIEDRIENYSATLRNFTPYARDEIRSAIAELQSLRDWITSSATGGAKEGE